MKSLEELRRYYAEDLLPELNVLEEQRREALNKIQLSTLIILLLAVPAFIFSIRIAGNIALFIIFAGLIGWMWLYGFFTKQYVRNFKSGIIGKIVNFIDPGLVYSRTGVISRELFKASGIFRHRIDNYSGDDHVSGDLGRTKVEFSEVYASYETRDSKGRKSEHTIFKGLFFAGDFNKHFKGSTVILPDTAERLMGHIGTFFQSMNRSRGELIKLENPEFEKAFAVYGNDQIEARYILSTNLMERIMSFRKKTGKRIYLSFKDSRIFVAVPYVKNLFEPRVFKTILDFKPVKEYFEDLKLATGIVDDLNLNTRIWSKR